MLFHRLFLLLFFLSFIFIGFGQRLVPLSKQQMHGAARVSGGAGDTLLLPFFEDFTDTFYRQATVPNPALWQPGSGVTINNSSAVIAPSYNTAIFDGANAAGVPYNLENVFNIDTNDILVSLPINIADARPGDSLRFTFYWQAAGFTEQPESEDSLFLDFLDTAGNWVRQWQVGGRSTSDFSRQSLDIGSRYFSGAFCFRFINLGRQGGSFDHWHLDYVHIYADTLPAGIPAYFDATLTSQPGSLFKKYRAISRKQLLAYEEILADTIALHIRSLQHLNADTLIHHAKLGYTLSDNLILTDLPTGTSGTNLNDTEVLLQPDETIDLYGFPSLLSNRVIRDISQSDDSIIVMNAIFYLQSDEKRQTALFRVNAQGDTTFFSSDNDTLHFDAYVADYLAYDDGSAEFGYELKQRFATLAYEYVLDTSDLLTGIDIYIPRLGNDLSNETFDVMVWQSIDTTGNQIDQVLLNGLSTTIVYTEGINEFRRIVLNQPIPLPKGKFYIGYRQVSAGLVPIGYDVNITSIPRIFTNNEGQWILDKRNVGHLMLRPVFQLNSVVTALNPLTEDIDLKVYPNPATDFLVVEGEFKTLYLYDILGRKMLSGTNETGRKEKIDISGLKEGLYFLKISDGQYFKTIKIIIK